MPSHHNSSTARPANPFAPTPEECALCLSPNKEPVVGLIPRGRCKGQQACEQCLQGLEEDTVNGFDAMPRMIDDPDDDSSGMLEAQYIEANGL